MEIEMVKNNSEKLKKQIELQKQRVKSQFEEIKDIKKTNREV